ncbi:MAG TPA: hypothetical protein VFQ74_08260 [Pseudolysinimonas sp.]|nr:hypothetical protein [Pseudolysinimonas sp.]
MPKFSALIVAVALVAALAGCAGTGQPGAQTSHTPSATPAPTPTPTPTPVATPLSLSVREPTLRDTISATAIVRNFPIDGMKNNDEIILIQVSVTTGGSYWAGWDTTRLLLIDGAGQEFPPKTLDNITAAMTRWGFTPFEVANNGSSIPHSRTSAPGWVAFDVYNVTKPLYFADRLVPVEGGTPSTYKVALP